MAEAERLRRKKRVEEPPFVLSLEYEPAEDAEDRLLTVYEFLLGLPEGPETCSEREELS